MNTFGEPDAPVGGSPIELGVHIVPLLESSRLILNADPFTREVLREALPSPRGGWSGHPLGTIRARRDDAPAPPPPHAEPSMCVSGITLWVDQPAAGHTHLRNAAGSVHGAVDRDSRGATLHVHSALSADERLDAGVALGLAVTLLVGHVGHAVVHAAGVIAPAGGAWMLVGDSRAGKSSATAALVSAGWDYLSDDAVILSPIRGGIRVEGWGSSIHLDRGFHAGVTTGHRVEFDPRSFRAGHWRASAELRGILFPRVSADLPTGLAPITRADAFVELVRQSPWLLADRGASPAVAALLSAAAEHPLARLTLGADSYALPERLTAVLSAMTSSR